MGKISEDLESLRDQVKKLSKLKRRHNILVLTNQPYRIFDAFNTYYKLSEYCDASMPVSVIAGLEHKPTVIKRMMDKNEDLIQIFLVSPELKNDHKVYDSLGSRCSHVYEFVY